MDIIKFTNPTTPTKMEQGQIVNGLTSKLWAERYREAGEFTFTAPVSSNMKNILPIGTFVTHKNTPEIMIVENHEINEDSSSEPDIVITGRGLETFIERRVVGANNVFPQHALLTDYTLAAGFTWVQAVNLLSDHILASLLINDDDAFPFVSVSHEVVGAGISIERQLKRGNLYSALLDLLQIDNLGIKIIRPNTPLSTANPNTQIIFHKGVDRTASVVFSHDTNEIVSADYLWSNKKSRNAALITGKWVGTVVLPAATGYNRGYIYVDATDLDQDFASAPVGPDLTNIIAAMQQRGIEALASLNDVAITRAQVSTEAVKAVYRQDFFVGDLITVSGDYNETSTMRISEYVESEDENGEQGSPSLAME